MQAKKLMFVAGLVSAAFVPAVFAAPSTNVYGSSADQQVGPIEALARQAWREDIATIATPSAGCFHASYPSIVWQRVACQAANPAVHPLPHYYLFAEQQTAGNGNDYTIQTGSNLITSAVGTFPTVSGITSEKSVGVAAYGDGGILGANQYSVQLNTQFSSTTTACNGGASGCTVWQQWVYATSYPNSGTGGIFMQDWLIGYENSCPSGFGSDGEGDCYENSNITATPDFSPTGTSLEGLKVTGTAASGGNDTAVVTYDGDAYSTSQPDSTLYISQVWNTGEFNIVGDAGGSEAKFNSSNVSIKVNLSVSDGSTSTPSCVADSGTTGESNNLNLGSCTASGGSNPSISFTETD
jgi:hypothetical protein